MTMTILEPACPSATPSGGRESAPHPSSAATRGDPRAGMGLQRPNTSTVVVWAAGELDMQRTSYWAELVTPRFAGMVSTVVLDLGRVTFLGVDALDLLVTTHHQALERGISLRLVTGPTAVERALRATGTDLQAIAYRSVGEAIAAPPAS